MYLILEMRYLDTEKFPNRRQRYRSAFANLYQRPRKKSSVANRKLAVRQDVQVTEIPKGEYSAGYQRRA